MSDDAPGALDIREILLLSPHRCEARPMAELPQ
jgi:hypothetical protein